MDSEQLQMYSMFARVFERMTLSLIVILIALVLIIAFWKSMQKIDFNLSKDNNQISTSVIFATPVFILLILVAFTYVSFSHPLVTSQNYDKAITDKESLPSPQNTDSPSNGGLKHKNGKPSIKFSFFAGMGQEELAEMIDSLNKSRIKLANYRSGKNKSIQEIAFAYSLINVTIDDLIRNAYGREVVNECLKEENKDSMETICKKIREWRSK